MNLPAHCAACPNPIQFPRNVYADLLGKLYCSIECLAAGVEHAC